MSIRTSRDAFRVSGLRVVLVIAAAVLMIAALSIRVHADSERTVVRSPYWVPAEDSVEVGIPGKYKAGQQDALDRINEIRLEACQNGYPDPRDRDRKLTMEDYKPVKWSTDLETYARVRAAEAEVYNAHGRPGTNEWNESGDDFITGYGETLAWGVGTAVRAVDLWYDEKDTWVNGGSGVTGHYTSMIDPEIDYVGIGVFSADTIYGSAWGTCVCGRYYGLFDEDPATIDETMLPAIDNIIQMISVRKEYLGETMLVESYYYPDPVPEKIELFEDEDITFYIGMNADFGKNTALLPPPETYTFASSNEKVMSVDISGNCKALNAGSCTVTATGSEGSKYSVKMKVYSLLSKPKIKSVKRKGTQMAITITTDNLSGYNANGYQVQIAKNKAFTKGLKKTTIKQTWNKRYDEPNFKLKKTVKKLSKKGTYYVRVRAYRKTSEGKKYSAWSKVKTVKK